MERKVKQVIVYKEVEDSVRDIDFFVAIDGREFTGITSERDCYEYEKKLEHSRKWSMIKHVSAGVSYRQPDEWYYASNLEELEMIKRYMAFYDNVYLHVNDMSKSMGDILPELKVGEWMGCDYDSNDNGIDSVYIYTLDYLNSKIEEFRNSFK